MALQNSGWAVFAPSGAVVWRSFATNREESIAGYLGQLWRDVWPTHEAAGFKCIELNFTPKATSLDAAIAETDTDMPGCAFQINRHFQELATCGVYITAPSGEHCEGDCNWPNQPWQEMDTGEATPAAMFRRVYATLKAGEIERGYWPPKADEED